MVVTAAGCAVAGDDTIDLSNSAGDKADKAITNVRLTNDPDGEFAAFTLLCEDTACDIKLELDVRDMYAVKDALEAAGSPVTQARPVELAKITVKGPLATNLEWEDTLTARLVVDSECPDGCVIAKTTLDLTRQPQGSYQIQITKSNLPSVTAIRIAVAAAWYAAK